MPVTPFHGGMGLLAKGFAGRRCSLVAFCVTQVVLDLESGYFLLRDEWPVHRFLHTLVGATAASGVTVWLCRLVALSWKTRLESASVLVRAARRDLETLSSRVTVVVTVALGVLGHVIPDGIMHSDMRPFAPFSDANPFEAAVSLAALHWILVGMGMVGAALVFRREKRSA